MKIRTQLIVSIVLFVLALLLISASMILTNQQVERLNKQKALVNSIELDASELGYLSNDYLLYPESQQLDRWNSKYASFSEDLSKLSVDRPEQQVLLNNIKKDQQRLKEVFGDVVSTFESANQTQHNSPDPAFIQVSWSRIAVQTRGIVFDASRLSQMLYDEENQAKQTNTLLIITMMGAFVTFLFIDYLLIYGRTIKSIAKLEAGTRIIGSGNLDYSLQVKNRDDEIGDLAGAFNSMVIRLKTVTASKADLESEISRRKQTEQALQEKHEQLEVQAEELEVINEELRSNNEELRESQEALRESEQRFRATFEQAAVGIAQLDLDGRFLRINQKYCDLVGYTMEGMLHRNFQSIIYPEDLDIDIDNSRQLLSGKIPTYSIEMRYVRKDDSLIWVLFTMSLERSQGGSPMYFINVIQDITKRKLAEEKIEYLASFPELNVNPIFEMDDRGAITYSNPAAKRLFPDLGSMGADHPMLKGIGHDMINKGQNSPIIRDVNFNGAFYQQTIFQVPESKTFRVYSIDITERKRADMEREITVEFLNLVNESKGIKDLIRGVATFFQRRSGCEAVGIRLHDGDDYPYYEARGFSEEFILLENRLCLRDDAGLPVYDGGGYPIMECMCGNVIQGRFDPSKPFFTARGSFWSNNTTELLATTTDAERQARTRNRCNGEGYESVALIAIRGGKETFGLIQLNDRRKGRFTLEYISLWERLADYLAVALAKFRSEESLRENEYNLAKSQEIAHLGSWTWDIKNDSQDWSDERYRIFGLAPGEIKPSFEVYMSFIYPEDRQLVENAYKIAIKEKKPLNIEYRIVRKDGTIRFMHSEGYITYNEKGEPLKIFGIGQDVTEQKQIEEALKESQKQAELYLDLMGHDISNMHQIMQGQLELAQEIMAEEGKLEGDEKEFIDTSIQTLERSAHLIDNVRKLQKLRAGEYKIETIDLGRVLGEVVRENSSFTDNDVAINYSPVTDYYVKANPLLKDVLTNLVGNAIKHSSGPARIGIDVSRVSDNGQVFYRVAIEDNGPGIPDSMKEKVFHRFKRGQTSAKGTGLGLYIVKTLVESFRGRVKVEDRVPGDYTKGARFIVYLPEAEDTHVG